MCTDGCFSHPPFLPEHRLRYDVGGLVIPNRHKVEARHGVVDSQGSETRAVGYRSAKEICIKFITARFDHKADDLLEVD